MVGTLLDVFVDGQRHHDIEVGIDQLLILSGYHILYLLDVLDSNEIAGVGHTGMTVFLFVEQREFTLLIRHENHLIVDDRLCQWYVVHDRHKVNWHRGIVDLNVGIRTDDTWEIDAVHIDKAVNLAAFIAHADTFIVHLEVGHRDNLVGKVHGEVTVNVVPGSASIQIGRIDAAVFQLVFDLANLHKEIAPFLTVKREEVALFVFLRDNEIGLNISIGATCEIAEIALT